MGDLDGECFDPKIDFAFKGVFGRRGNEDLLASLIEAVVSPPEAITEVEILNPFLDVEVEGEKLSILDVRVRDRTGKQYAIEMQIRSGAAFAERILFYASRILGRELGRGRPYTALEPLIVIVFTGHVLFEGLSGYHNVFELWDAEGRVRFTRHLRIDTIELPKWGRSLAEATTPLEAWVAVLKEGHRMSRETIEKTGLPELVKAREELERLSADPVMRERYEERIQALHDYVSSMEIARQEGIEEGIQKGIQKGIEEGIEKVARRLLAKGFSAVQVAELTGLAEDEVRELDRGAGP